MIDPKTQVAIIRLERVRKDLILTKSISWGFGIILPLLFVYLWLVQKLSPMELLIYIIVTSFVLSFCIFRVFGLKKLYTDLQKETNIFETG